MNDSELRMVRRLCSKVGYRGMSATNVDSVLSAAPRLVDEIELLRSQLASLTAERDSLRGEVERVTRERDGAQALAATLAELQGEDQANAIDRGHERDSAIARAETAERTLDSMNAAAVGYEDGIIADVERDTAEKIAAWLESNNKGQNTRRTKLSPALIEDARQRRANGETWVSIARLRGCSPATVREAVGGKYWKNLTAAIAAEGDAE